MENHFHAIVQALELSAVMADLKKFTARRRLDQLPREGRDWLLRLLEEKRARHKTASQDQLWQEGFHPQAILDDAMMRQGRAERTERSEIACTKCSRQGARGGARQTD